jgi:hypothetical protein
MTVRELIEKLEQVGLDIPVVFWKDYRDPYPEETDKINLKEGTYVTKDGDSNTAKYIEIS